MADSLVIPRRFNGPPDSGHGGYSAGLAAGLVDGPAEVRLTAPPPLETEMRVERDGDAYTVRAGDTAVMRAAPAEVAMEVPEPITLDEVRASDAPSPLLDDGHPFPTCFGCGPQRAEGDGLRLFPKAVRDGSVFGVEWSPAAEFAGPEGSLAPLFIWTALDCPSCTPAMGGGPIVLASLAAQIKAPVVAESPHVIGSWSVANEGRKRFTGVALWDEAGVLCASARALWIELPT